MQTKKQNQEFSRLLAAVWNKNGDKPCYLPESYLVTRSTIHSQTQPIFPVLPGQTQAWHSCRSTPGTGMESSGPRHQSVRQKMNATIFLFVLILCKMELKKFLVKECKHKPHQYIESRENNSCRPASEADITEAVELLVDWDGCKSRSMHVNLSSGIANSKYAWISTFSEV
jgi:hypothetical protein